MGWLRYPKTMNEQRANTSAGLFVRGARKPHNLPDAWDDIMPRYERSWKAHREAQSRLVEVKP